MKSNNKPKSNKPWYKRKWVWAVAVLWLLVIIIAVNGGDSSTQNVDNKQASKPAPQFAAYINKPMTEAATAFGQTYDPVKLPLPATPRLNVNL